MTTETEPVLRLTRPAEWLQAIPYLFGFIPAESLVVLGLDGPRKRVRFQMRVDLPAPEDVLGLAIHVADVLERQDVDRVLVVVFGTEPGPPNAADRDLWECLSDELALRETLAHIDVVDAIVARAGRWWSLECGNPRCCPPEGTAYDAGAGRVPAEMVLRGCVARDSRDDVAAELAAYGGPAEVLVAQRCRALYDADRAPGADPWAWSMPWVDTAVERWREVLTARGAQASALDGETVAHLLYPLDHKTLRDRVAGVCMKHSARAKPLLREVIRRAPREYVAPPATILGLLEWADGDGLRAMIAFERALAGDPDYSFAAMLQQGLQHGIRLPDDYFDSIREMARKRWRTPSRRRSSRQVG